MCIVHVEACYGEGCLFGFCLNCDHKFFFFGGKLSKSCPQPFLLSECTAELGVNLLLTKVDLWEWCCTRRGFSLSSMRFGTFFHPRWSLGGHVLNLLKDARGGEALYVVKPEGYLNDLSNRVCMKCLAACVSGCSFRVVQVLCKSYWIKHIVSLCWKWTRMTQQSQTRFVSFWIWRQPYAWRFILSLWLSLQIMDLEIDSN